MACVQLPVAQLIYKDVYKYFFRCYSDYIFVNLQYLRCHPSIGPCFSCHDSTLCLNTCNTKVSNLNNLHLNFNSAYLSTSIKNSNWSLYLMLIHQKICSLQISVDNIILMQIIHPFRNINCYPKHYWELKDTPLVVKIIINTSTRHELWRQQWKEAWKISLKAVHIIFN